MSRRTRFAQTLSLALLAAGMSVSVAQAKPFEPPRGVQPHVVSAQIRAAVDTQGWTAALLSSDSSKAAWLAAHPSATAPKLYLLAGTATQATAPRGQVDTQDWTSALLSSDSSKAARYAAAQTPPSSGSGPNWTAVLVWGTISVILIGALAVGGFRTRPRRPAAA